MTDLFEHQKSGVIFLKEKKKAILADEMGLGKTRQAIIAAGEDSEGAIIVVCPASLKINWKREIEAVYPEDEVFVASTGKDELRGNFAWYIVNYDLLDKLKVQVMALIADKTITAGIFDEIHYIKGKTIRAKATLEISKELEIVYGLTGTPMLNRPIELYHPLKAIQHPLGMLSRKEYGVRYCGAYLRQLGYYGARFWDETGATNLGELRERLQGAMLRRLKKDVLDLPPKIITTVDVKMTKEEKSAYDTAWATYLQWVKENQPDKDLGNILMAQQLVELGKLKQVCSRAKIKRVVDDAENAISQGNKVIIFSQYTETIKQIADGIKKVKIPSPSDPKRDVKAKAVTLTGSDDQNERQKAVDAFQNDAQTMAFVGNIKAAGVGLTLTASSIVIFADMDWSPEIHAQAEDRAHRIGQQGTVSVYYYVCTDTIEEDIMKILADKKKVITEILEGKKNRVRAVAMGEEIIRKVQARAGYQH